MENNKTLFGCIGNLLDVIIFGDLFDDAESSLLLLFLVLHFFESFPGVFIEKFVVELIIRIFFIFDCSVDSILGDFVVLSKGLLLFSGLIVAILDMDILPLRRDSVSHF